VKNSSVCTVKAGEKDAGSAGCWPGSRRCCRAGDMHQGTRRCRRSLRAFTAWSLPIGPSVFGYTRTCEPKLPAGRASVSLQYYIRGHT
jgi:hypothetical protein